MMRLRNLGALAYRELYLSKKRLLPFLIAFLIFAVLAILVILSFDYGNLGSFISNEIIANQKRPEDIRMSEEEMTQTINKIKSFIVLFAKAYPLLLTGFSGICFLETSDTDEKGKWLYFYKSTPASPSLKAAATFSVVIAFNILGFAVAVLFCYLLSALSGIDVTIIDYGMILSVIAAGDLLGVILQIGIKLLHSVDKAGIVLTCCLIAAVIGYEASLTVNNSPKENDIMVVFSQISETLSAFSEKAIYIAPIIIVLSIVLGFTANVLIYKRREK